jgi:hypothetical protein
LLSRRPWRWLWGDARGTCRSLQQRRDCAEGHIDARKTNRAKQPEGSENETAIYEGSRVYRVGRAAPDLRRYNRALVLGLIRELGPTSRADLGREGQLSMPTRWRSWTFALTITPGPHDQDVGAHPQELAQVGVPASGRELPHHLAFVGAALLADRYREGVDHQERLFDTLLCS